MSLHRFKCEKCEREQDLPISYDEPEPICCIHCGGELESLFTAPVPFRNLIPLPMHIACWKLEDRFVAYP